MPPKPLPNEPMSAGRFPAETFEEPSEETSPIPEPIPEPAPPQAIRYNGQGTFVATGAATGSRYTFRGHGAILAVDADDADPLLQTELRRSRCCGRGTQVLRPFETIPTGGADYSHDD